MFLKDGFYLSCFFDWLEIFFEVISFMSLKTEHEYLVFIFLLVFLCVNCVYCVFTIRV